MRHFLVIPPRDDSPQSDSRQASPFSSNHSRPSSSRNTTDPSALTTARRHQRNGSSTRAQDGSPYSGRSTVAPRCNAPLAVPVCRPSTECRRPGAACRQRPALGARVGEPPVEADARRFCAGGGTELPKNTSMSSASPLVAMTVWACTYQGVERQAGGSQCRKSASSFSTIWGWSTGMM